jgi:hypothetical protein
MLQDEFIEGDVGGHGQRRGESDITKFGGGLPCEWSVERPRQTIVRAVRWRQSVSGTVLRRRRVLHNFHPARYSILLFFRFSFNELYFLKKYLLLLRQQL